MAQRTSQIAVEALVGGQTPNARVSQIAVEALVGGQVPAARVSQIAIEILVGMKFPYAGLNPAEHSGLSSWPLPTFVRGVSSQGSSSGGNSKTLNSLSVSDGSALILACAIYPSSTITAISDGLGNTYLPIGSGLVGGDGVRVQMYYAPWTAAGTCTPVLTFSAPIQSYSVFWLEEVTGLDPFDTLDKNSYASGTATGSVNGGSVTTLFDGEYVFGFCEADGVTPTEGAGYTSRGNVGQGTLVLGMRAEDEVQASKGAVTAPFTLSSSSPYVAAIATFRPRQAHTRHRGAVGKPEVPHYCPVTRSSIVRANGYSAQHGSVVP